jgi:glycerol-3-phosphate dehydrogenase (NAD(P)+)
MWALEPEVVEKINESHENCAYLPGVALPDGIRATVNPEEALSEADLVLLVPPSQHLRSVSLRIHSHLPGAAIVAIATKGVEDVTMNLMSEVVAETLPSVSPDGLAFVSGPSFASEVARGLPTNVVVASDTPSGARAVQRLLHSPQFRVYTSADPIGVQLGGAVKNVIAIAAGICDGLDLGTNARASLVTRGLAEITRLGVALGANPLTFLGMAGVGDLVLTCTGPLSRNRALGMKVAQGVDPKTYLASVRSVAEGFATAAATYRLATRHSVDMPITDQVFHVLHAGRPVLDALRLLVTRDFKDELVGIDEHGGH